VKTERLESLPKGEIGEFYYRYLKLPCATFDPQRVPHQVDPTIANIMDITTDAGDQLGFVILRDDDTLEVVDAVTGEHFRLTLGQPEADKPYDQGTQALVQVALFESKTISESVADIIGHLERKEHLVALGTFQGAEHRFKFLGTVLEAATRRRTTN
jgi:hypothetical protein